MYIIDLATVHAIGPDDANITATLFFNDTILFPFRFVIYSL
jgi:hypothetical protein